MSVTRRGRLAGRLRHEDGVAAVEFAIVASLLFVLVFGIIQFGLALSKIETFENAARQGGREAAVSASVATFTGTKIKSDVVAAASPYTITNGTQSGSSAITINLVKSGVTSTPSDGAAPCSGVGTTDNWQVKVSWTQRIAVNIPFWRNANINHTMSATFRCEPASS